MLLNLSSGGEIPQDQNQDLINQVNDAHELTPTDLFKLAIFYQTYQTNESLSNHLALLGLKGLVSNPDMQRGLSRHDRSRAKFATIIALAATSSKVSQRQVRATSAAPFDDLGDLIEDWLNGTIDTEDATEVHPALAPTTVAKWVLFSGVGLLVEVVTPEIGQPKYYVIGVCPDPASLPS